MKAGGRDEVAAKLGIPVAAAAWTVGKFAGLKIGGTTMFKQGVGSFKYYVGISSLDQIATRDDRVCVLNILGGESSDVTPVGRLLGRQRGVRHLARPQRPGPGNAGRQCPGLQQRPRGSRGGASFNCGVIYLPPSGARTASPS